MIPELIAMPSQLERSTNRLGSAATSVDRGSTHESSVRRAPSAATETIDGMLFVGLRPALHHRAA
jgi:hypothetical protein